MTINGIDVSIYGAKQWNVKMNHSEVTSGTEWAAGNIRPFFWDTKFGIKKIKVTLMVYGENRAEIWNKCGLILSVLRKEAEIKLDGFYNTFIMNLDGEPEHDESKMERWHKFTVNLAGYERGDLQRVVLYDHMEFTNPLGETPVLTEVINNGTLETPVDLEITIGPYAEQNRFTCVIGNLVRNAIGSKAYDIIFKGRNGLTGINVKLIVFSGMEGTVSVHTNNGQEVGLIGLSAGTGFSSYGIPTLMPGKNTVSCKRIDENRGDQGFRVTMSYRPFYA